MRFRKQGSNGSIGEYWVAGKELSKELRRVRRGHETALARRVKENSKESLKYVKNKKMRGVKIGPIRDKGGKMCLEAVEKSIVINIYLSTASSDNGCFPSLSSETQRASDMMAKSETYMKKQFVKPDSLSPSGAKPDVSYVELHFKSLSAPQVRTNGDGLISTYSELNFRRDDPLIDEEDNAHITSGPGGMPTTAQTAAQERKSKVKIGNRRYRLICLLCLVTSALIVIVVGLSIHSEWNGLRVGSDRK
ncbi:uncharacterized protein [Hemitrygon akajei]|uniref:uncharacterized protein n=1 Tax=Hemitrygon akajei TaxID=2704970 RepID=UPI003BF99A9E